MTHRQEPSPYYSGPGQAAGPYGTGAAGPRVFGGGAGVACNVKRESFGPSSPIAPGRPPQPVASWGAPSGHPVMTRYDHLHAAAADEELNRISSGSSVLEQGALVGESGRTYHSYKAESSGYLLPNDPAEQDRLDLQHALMTFLWDGRLNLAPLPHAPRMVLDVASGTGIWALEFARRHPTSSVVGNDLSKIQPPPDVANCFFERMDCEDDWMWTTRFDYVHVRMIVAAIRDPRRLLRQAFESLNPGGWIELADMDGDLLPDEGPAADPRVAVSNVKRWFDLCAIGAAMQGIDTHKAKHYKKWLIEAGCK